MIKYLKYIKKWPLLLKLMWVNCIIIVSIGIAGTIYGFYAMYITLPLLIVQGILAYIQTKKIKKNISEIKLKVVKEMMMLVIDEDFKDNINKIVNFAKENPLSMDDLLDMHNGQMKLTGDTEGYYWFSPLGIKIVHCIEQQVPGDCRYLSISVPGENKLPHPIMVEEIMSLVGFKNGILKSDVVMEKIGEKRRAVSIREIIKNE